MFVYLIMLSTNTQQILSQGSDSENKDARKHKKSQDLQLNVSQNTDLFHLEKNII